MILANGCNGIGTGFSTKIPCYNPKDLIDYLKNMLLFETSSITIKPYYRGFKGTIEEEKENSGKYIIKGVYSIKELQVTITELPIGMWTDTYKQFLEDSLGTLIKDYTDKSTDVDIHIVVTLLAPSSNVESDLKLTTSISTTNMHLINAKNQLRKYKTVYEIIDEYAEVRLQMYTVRKQYLLDKLDKLLVEITHKVKYIHAVLQGKIDLRNKKQDEITQLLKAYDLVQHDGSYHYLIKMPMDSVSDENVKQLEAELAKLTKEKALLSSTTERQMWLNELEELKKQL
jgi:DNA topoisomerase-2